MRLLFTSFPAVGHLHPLLPLALAARDAGHEVVVATGPDEVGWVRACGLHAEPCGLARREATARSVELAPTPAEETAYLFCRVAAPALLADALRLAGGHPPDLVVHEESEFAGPLLAALVGVPCVTHSWPAPVKRGALRASATALLQELWDRHAAGPARIHGDCYLDACPRALQTDEIDAITPPVRRVRAIPFDGPAAQPDIDVAALPRPLAYVTLGTVEVFSRPDVLRRVVDAVAPAMASVVATTGPNDPAALDNAPAGVHATAYLAQSHVLPHADVVVSHGGAGTTLGALCAGLPHLVLPQGAPSQTQNAERVQTLGLGLRGSDADPAAIRRHVERLLSDNSFARAAARVRAEIDEAPAPETVVTELVNAYAPDVSDA